MSATLQIIEIKKGSPYLPQVQALYESAFPANERIPMKQLLDTALPLRSAVFQILFHTATSRTSSISRLSQNCAVADTVHKSCRPSAGNTPTRASLSISKSKKIPRTPRNSNAGTAAATFTSVTVLTPRPSNTTGRANITAYSAQAAPSPKKNSAISGKKS